tara:strand:- start:3140 stop:3532 length:393 start_codon:yes stop_codon:yes gene_type:complete
MIYIQILAVVGLLLSIYSLYIEKKLKVQTSYSPVCDISKEVSCSAAFTSEYSKTFGITNSILGIGFYVLVLLLSVTSYASFILYLAIAGILASIRLAYISYFKLKNFCVVCTGIYIISLLLLILSRIKFA